MERQRAHSNRLFNAAAAALALAAVLAAGQARAQAPTAPAALPTADFMQIMALLTAFEQKAGNLAAVLGQNNDLRRYASRVGDEQARSVQPLNQAAASAQVNVPVVLVLPAGQLAVINTLTNAPARDFDRMFTDVQVQTQQEALNLAQGYAANGDNASIKAAAAKMTVAFQQHLDQAKAAQRLVR